MSRKASPDDFGVDLLRNAYNTYKTSKLTPFPDLYLEIDRECNILFEELYLTKYEIAEWQGFYLRLWAKSEVELDHVLAENFLKEISVETVPLFQNYFSISHGKVTISLFIEFICVFAFFYNKDLLKLMLSISNIQSNRFVSEKQISSFLSDLNVDDDQIHTVVHWARSLKENHDSLIHLTTFYQYIISHDYLLTALDILRTQLLRCIIGQESYYTILTRRNYYKKITSAGVTVAPPKENCYQHCYRTLISGRPPPYYYDYKPQVVQKKTGRCLLYIRKRYGYSNRPDRESSKRSLCSSRKNESYASLSSYCSKTIYLNSKSLLINKSSCKGDGRIISDVPGTVNLD